jgi:GNAT superfamily N-acetyltransferase
MKSVALRTGAEPFLPAGLGREEGVPVRITVVGSADLVELQPLMRAYCDFYQVAPGDKALLELSQALLADPQREGLQLLVRDDSGRAVGLATLYWTWQTLAAARVGVMNDLYVAAEARGAGVADRLIAACLERCREHGATQLVWQTAVDNPGGARHPPARWGAADLARAGRGGRGRESGHLDPGGRLQDTQPATRPDSRAVRAVR